MDDISGAICAPMCESNDDCAEALSASCANMVGVRPLCSLSVNDVKYCGLFCQRDDDLESNSSLNGAQCDDSGLAMCSPIPATQRSLCVFTA